MKGYNEITSPLIERKKHRRKNISRIASLGLAVIIALGVGFMKLDLLNGSKKEEVSDFENKNPSESVDSAGEKAYPYEDKIQYLPKEVSVSKYDDGFLAYNQIKKIDADIIDIYAVLYDSSQLKRDCHPMFEEDGSVTFLRINRESDTDEKRYAEMVSYIGNQQIMTTLSDLPQNSSGNISCILFQHARNPETTGVGLKVDVYENCRLNVVVTKNIDSVFDDDIKGVMDEIKAADEKSAVSWLGDKNISVHFVYQTRLNKEKNVSEERFVYYALFTQDELDYLVQFSSNFTLQNSNINAYGVKRRSQEECRKAFELILREILGG